MNLPRSSRVDLARQLPDGIDEVGDVSQAVLAKHHDDGNARREEKRSRPNLHAAQGIRRARALRAAMRILLVGAGAIGSAVARAAETIPDVERVLVFDARPGVAAKLASGLSKAEAADDFERALHASDLVVEAASQEAVAQYAPHALRAGCDVILASSGALANDALRETLEREARAAKRRVYVPSGAIGGLDAIKAAREARLDRVTITTAKPPAGLGKAASEGPVTLYEGPARDAVKQFPKNVNVAASLSLAGLGLDATRVRIVADPALDKNTHTIEAVGAFGSLRVEVANEPSPDNPATSWLAALSIIALLKRIVAPIQVGT